MFACNRLIYVLFFQIMQVKSEISLSRQISFSHQSVLIQTMMKFYLILLICIPLIRAAAVPISTNCLYGYLKTKGIDVEGDIAFNGHLDPKCEELVNQVKNNVYGETFDTLFQNEKYKNDETCFKEYVESSEFMDTRLIGIYYNNNKEIDELKRLEMVKICNQNCTEIKVHAMVTCFFHHELDNDIPSGMTPDEDFCVRKYIVDNNLLTYDDVMLALNPKSIDVSNMSCDASVQKATKMIEGILKKLRPSKDESDNDITNCWLRKMHEGNYIAQALEYAYLKELQLNAKRENDLRKKFGRAMCEMAKDNIKCFVTLNKL